MRSAAEIKKLIIDTANKDERIRAVLLNGSRANPKIQPDPYQDFDIVYVVNQLQTFTYDHNWVDVFGERIIMQLPDEMIFGEKRDEGFGYLMLFKDGNRIDLTLFPSDKVKKNYWPDSLTIVWLDKDALFQNLPKPSDTDYFIKGPTEKEFQDVCNEFWWVTTYVAKGLLRHEITYAKEKMDTVVRPMYLKVIEWYIGLNTDFKVAIGEAGRFMPQYLSTEQIENIVSTYADYVIENNWRALYVMTESFSEVAKIVAEELNYKYDIADDENVREYLSKLK
jgi:aminoglycoside 6-adenylyltransferase